MFKETIRSLIHLTGLSIHRKVSIERLLRENERLKGHLNTLSTNVAPQSAPPRSAVVSSQAHTVAGDATLWEECERLRTELKKHEDRQIFYLTTEDYNSAHKMRHIVDRIPDFGFADFADLSCWIFAASLNNHRVVHQRIDEGSLLWRAVKMSGGPILEVGRAAGGSTLVLLGASGARPVISIDRAPFHAHIADRVFQRADVARRLTLYRQTSREPIAEKEFGMIFIDADHSFEGVCHDIAMFWNQLKSFDGKPALATFHDAADNPITYVEPVKRACEELVAEPGAARIVESWGSMLVLEKTGDIDADRWFRKEHLAFWGQYATPDHPVLRPAVLRGQIHPTRVSVNTAAKNLLGDESVEHESWVKRGVSVERTQLNDDNPLRLIRDTSETGEHGIEKTIHVGARRINYAVYVRPHRLSAIRVSVRSETGAPLVQVDYELGVRSRIGLFRTADGVTLIDASFDYRNGYFCCNVAIDFGTNIKTATFAVGSLGTNAATSYQGEGRGFFHNLSSVREIIN